MGPSEVGFPMSLSRNLSHGKVVSISARHAENPGSIPGRGVSKECEDTTKGAPQWA